MSEEGLWLAGTVWTTHNPGYAQPLHNNKLLQGGGLECAADVQNGGNGAAIIHPHGSQHSHLRLQTITEAETDTDQR